MHHFFKRMVVLLNDLENVDNLLKKATDFSKEHESSLEILYIQEEVLFNIPDYFLSEEKIANERLDKKRVKSKIQEHLLNLGIEKNPAILVYEDDTVDQIMHYGKEQKDILFITAYHQELSRKLLKKTPYSFWVVKNDTQSYSNIVLPIDFSEDGKKALQMSKHIFPQKSITMLHDYRYVLDTMSVQVEYLDIVPMLTPEIITFNKILKKEQKKKFENYKKEFDIKGTCIEGEGALDQDLILYISKSSFDLTIMYHQDAELFLSPSLILELLEGVSTDFFILNL